MKISVHTYHNRGFQWIQRSGIWFKGQIRYRGDLLEKEEAVKFFSHFPDFDMLVNALGEVDGMFSVIVQSGDRMLLVVDRMRTFPVFYHSTSDLLTVTDDPWHLPGSQRLGDVDVKEFLLTGFTTGRRTLLEGVFQCRPGEAVILGNGHVDVRPYYSHIVQNVWHDSFEECSVRLKDLLYEVFEEFVQSLNGRPVALSLSGGYDSRLIAWMLHEYGHEKVLCFTYGRKGNAELANSRRTAELLGYEWLFIEYHAGMAEDYLNTLEFKEYTRFASRFTSMPFLTDYFAARYIRDHQLVPEETVFLCGHSGDTIAGSHLKGKFSLNDPVGRAARVIFNTNYQLSHIPGKRYYYDRLKRELGQHSGPAYAIFEDWILKERQAKFIVNSACTYDFFGYAYRIPLWDLRLLEFFAHIPLRFKNYKLLYVQVLRELFRLKKLDFDHELQATVREIQFQKVKDRIKSLLPDAWIAPFRDQLPWHAYDLFTVPMAEKIRGTVYEKQCGPEHNSIICNWYVAELENFIQK